MYPPNVKIAVAEQIINMLLNNIVNAHGNESFVGWCEDGEVFYNSYPTAHINWLNECEKLMNEVAPVVDKLTYEYLDLNIRDYETGK